MRTYEEIYDLFIDLINNKINEVKIGLAEINMISKIRPKFNYVLKNIYMEGLQYTPSDILKEMCIENNIIQYEDLTNNCYIYKKK